MERNLRKIASLLSLLACGITFAGMEDQVLRFSTPGPDRYADGSVVRDGECYALVWSPKGTAFAGFNADGTAVSANDRVVLAASLAKDGKCRDTIFQIPGAENVEWAVCLVDTRMANGFPAGVQDGVPARVNRWGVVNGGVAIAAAGSVRPRLLAAGGTRSVAPDGSRGATASGVRAGNLSAIPPNLMPPQITAIEVGDGAVALAVKNTVPYLTYTVSSSATLGGFSRDKYADRRDGAADSEAEIVLETDAPGASRFFKITRVE